MILEAIIVALFQAAAGPAETPQAEPEQPAQAEAQQAQPEQRRRCRREIITGTRLTRLVCTTPEQDRELETDARDGINRIQSQIPLTGN